MTLFFPRFRHRTVRFLCDFMVAGFLLAKDLIQKRQRQEFFIWLAGFPTVRLTVRRKEIIANGETGEKTVPVQAGAVLLLMWYYICV